MRAFGKKQKDQFDQKIRFLQDELQTLQDQHLNEVGISMT